MPAQPQDKIPVNAAEKLSELSKKILDVTSMLGVFAKEGRNEMQRYSFVSYEQLNAKLAEILPRVGLSLVYSFDEIEEREITNARGGVFTRTIIKGSVMIIDCATGYSIKAKLIGADVDTAGKSAGKAITEAVKRFQMKLFHVVTADDADPDSRGTDINAGFFAAPQQQMQYPQQGYRR